MLLLFVVVVAVIRGLPASRSPLLCCSARKFEVILRAVSKKLYEYYPDFYSLCIIVDVL